MTGVLLVRTSSGELRSVEASGHASYSVRGSDIVCAAETTLLRTVLEVLESADGIKVVSSAEERGRLSFSVAERNPALSGLLEFAADFLRTGFRDLSSEYPLNISFEERICY